MKKREKGTYVLIIEVPKREVIKVGCLGAITFPKGLYAYVGSALNGMESRINRHLRREKRVYWHIDYLLNKASIKAVIFAKTEKRMECNIAQNLAKNFVSLVSFGSSDCKCKSHLFLLGQKGETDR